MKQFGKKTVLFVLVTIVVAVAVCCAVTVGNNNVATAQAETVAVDELFVVNYSDTGIELLLNGRIRDYLRANKGDLSELSGTLMTAIRSILTNGILNGEASVSGASETSLPEGFDPSSFDWSSSETLNKFKDYVIDRLSDAEEFQNYVDGKYDLLIDYAIGTYMEDKTENIDEEYSKLQSAIQDVVNEAYENAVEDAKTQLGEYFDESEWIAKKEQATEKVVERVETVQNNGGKATITFEQIVGAIKGVSLDGIEIYSSVDGLSLNALKTLAKNLPMPSAIAEMTDSQLATLIDYDVLLSTSFGNVSFGLKLGFFGDVQNVRSVAKQIADRVTLDVNGNNIDVEIKVPALATELLKSIYNSDKFDDEQKAFVYGLFNTSLADIDLAEVVEFLQGVDYKYFLSKLVDADYLNANYGKFVRAFLGRDLTNEDIDRVIDKICSYVVPKLQTAKSMSVEELTDWLNAHVPGFASSSDEMVRALADLLLDLSKDVDFSVYNASYIRSVIADPSYDLNGKISDYLGGLTALDELYQAAVRYFERMVSKLPSVATGHSLMDIFDGANFVLDGTVTVEYKTLFARASSVLNRLGLQNFAKYVSKASILLNTKSTTFDLSATIIVSDLHKVEYVYGDKVLASGIVPSGVDGKVMQSLSGIDVIDGYTVSSWVDENGNALDVMPNDNIVLKPVLALSVSLSDDIVAIYDENKDNTLVATVNGSSSATYSYAWYRDGELLENVSSSTLTLKNVSESGLYRVVVTDVALGLTADAQATVTISPKTVTAPKDWNRNYVFVYGKDVKVSYSGILTGDKYAFGEVEYNYYRGDEQIDVTAEDFVWNVGNYTVTATVSLLNDNYATADGNVTWTKTASIVINAKLLNLSGANWIVDDDLVYDGSEKSFALSLDDVALSDEEKSFVLSRLTYSVNNAAVADLSVVDAGIYIVKATVDTADSNYICTALPVKVLRVQKAEVSANVTWNYTAPYVYDKSEHTLEATVVVADLDDSQYSYRLLGVSRATNVGNYQAVVLVTLNDTNYSLSQNVFVQEWSIDPCEVNAPSAWDETLDFVYGEKVSFNYQIANAEYYSSVSYRIETSDGQSVSSFDALDVGEYVVKAEFSLINPNYVAKGSNQSSWTLTNVLTISPKVLDLTDATWIASDNAVYTSRAYSVSLNLASVQLTAKERLFLNGSLVYSVNGAKVNGAVKLTDAGVYTVSLGVKEGASNNYVVRTKSFEFVITPATVKVSLNWGSNSKLNYDGTEKSVDATIKVVCKNIVLGENDYQVVKSGNFKATQKGNYVATVKIVLTNSNYQLDGKGEYSYNWSIVDDNASVWENGKEFGKDGDTKVEVISGSVPKGYDISSKTVDLTEEQIKKIKELLDGKDFEIVSAKDICFKDGANVEKTVNGQFRVSIPIPEKYLSHNGEFGVIHIGDDGKVTVVVGAVRLGNNMEFVTDGFSVFAVVAFDTDATNILPLIIVIVVLAVLLIVAIIVIIVLAKRNKKKAQATEDSDDQNDQPTEENVATEEPVQPEEVTAESVEDNAEEHSDDVAEETPETTSEEMVVNETEPETTEETPEPETTEEEQPVDANSVEQSENNEEQPETAIEEPVENVEVETSVSTDSSEPEPITDNEVIINPVVSVEEVSQETEPQMVEILDRSFTARLSQADDTLKANYNAIKNALLSYKKVHSRVSWGYDSFNKGREKVCKIVIRGKSLMVYLAINPYTISPKYHHKDVSNVGKYSSTPTRLKVRSGRSVKYAIELVGILMEERQVKQGEVQNTKYAPDCMTDEELKAQGLIKSKMVKAGQNSPWSNR